ncbi:MAG TPA: alpha/beta hydrolase [Candidatus Dormibacteraeota bacterium]
MERPTERNDAIEIEGRRLAWRSVGEGPPLLLITGYSGAAAGWDPQFLAALGRSFEVICPDNRGMGDSQLGELREPLTIEAMAADVVALLDAREIERLPVAGWSMGGFIAQALAIQAPARVEALVLLATNPGGDAAVPGDPAAFERLTDHSGTPREQATRLIELVFPANVAAEMNQRIGDVVAADRAALSPATLAAQQAAIGAWSAKGLARPDAGSPPVLAVCGSEDAVIRPENTDRLAARWPNCRAECFEGDGHALQAQEPERLAALIASFLDE